MKSGLIWWGVGIAVGAALLGSQTNPGQSAVEDVQAAVSGWKAVNQGPVWVPALNAAEVQFNIPTDLLARIAYEESRFRADVITGAKASSAGALGLMQLEPAYFASVRVARPFAAADTQAQIQEAAALLAQLYGRFSDWGLALAAYNDGAANIASYLAGNHQLKPETVNYVADILTDVPLPGATMPA